PATSVVLRPTALTVDLTGNLFIADYNYNRILRVDSETGILTTAAGSGCTGFFGDGGPATSACLAGQPQFPPQGLAVDTGGNLWIADTGNRRVRRVDARTGIINTVA